MTATDPSRTGDSPCAGVVSLPVARPDTGKASPFEPEARDFDSVYAAFFPFVWRCLRAFGVPDADDAAQDVFVVVHRRLAEFRGSSSLRTWLYGIVRNVAFNHRRRVGRKGRGEPLDADLPSPSPGPGERFEEAEAADFVQRFLATVDEKKREVFVLILIEGLSVPEVAEALEIPLNTAYSRLRAVRSEFRAAFSARRSP